MTFDDDFLQTNFQAQIREISKLKQDLVERGEKFEMTWEDGEHALLRIYSKDMKDGNGLRIRRERQEYPGVRLDAAIHEKLRT